MHRNVCLSVLSVAALSAPALAAPTWNAFVIRNASNPVTPIAATGTSDGSLFTALIDEGSEKAGYGTSYFDHSKVGTLTALNFTRLDTGSASVYLNLWVTDGTHYADIAPVVGMNSSGNYTGGVDVRGQDLQTLGFNVYDTDLTDLTWMYAGATRLQQGLISGTHVVTLGDIAGLTVAAPDTYSSFVGSGAARNGTGFNLIVGDTQGNFTSPVPYLVSDVTVPEPASLGLLAGAAVIGLRRRRA